MLGEPSPASLPLLAQHAKAAGNAEICVKFSLEASRMALESNAPEEVLRVVEVALPSAAGPTERVKLLDARDRALEMLRRPEDRLQGLAELSALAGALGDTRLELDVRLRRAASLRMQEEEERAAQVAREVRELAAASGDETTELAACIELGQDLLKSPLGEGYVPGGDADLDGAEEAYRRAVELARGLGDDASLAACLRELGIVRLGGMRRWFVDQMLANEHLPILRRVAAGESLDDVLPELPIAPIFQEAAELFQEALELFERLGDRRGAMSTIIAMGYLSWAPDIHLGSNAARHIEEIRRLTSRMKAFTTESERAAFEAQLLYGVHVFARGKVIPDLAVSRGEQAYAKARELGDHALQFLSAGGTALALFDLGETQEGLGWLDRASATAIESPTPLRARRLETWRGFAFASAGDAEQMLQHLQRAVELAAERGHPAARCEALAQLALSAAHLGAQRDDPALLDVAERSAREAAALAPDLAGHAPWGAKADAALAQVALARGEREEAIAHARSALEAVMAAKHEDLHLDVLTPVAKVLQAAEAPEWEGLRDHLQRSLAMIAQRTLDEDVRVRWFRGPVGREVSTLVGPLEAAIVGDGDGDGAHLEEADAAMLRSLIQGRTNAEIAEELGLDETAVARTLGELFARIGTSSRAEATAFAFRERVL
jgi:tetratricopeptide (TPR) repeat protein/DNA-binding CsgD family transcriptional regulator